MFLVLPPVGSPEAVEAVQAVTPGLGQELLRRAGDALRQPNTDVPSLLERFAGALGSRAALAIRGTDSAVIVDAAWHAGSSWRHQTSVLSDLDRPSMDEIDAETLVALVCEALSLPPAAQWKAGRAPGDPCVVGVADADLRLARSTMDALATGLGLLIARDAAVATARVNALLLERARIASEIHQGVCQEIATLNLQLQVLEELLDRDPSSARALLTEIERSAGICAQNLRSTLVHLTPVTPDNSWLTGGLRRFVSDFARTWGMELSFDVLGRTKVLEPERLALIFAFVQEGLTNMSKHSSGTRGAVRVAFGDRTLRVDVVDGARARARARRDPRSAPFGHGLSLMRARARLLGGDVKLVRSDKESARLTLELPI